MAGRGQHVDVIRPATAIRPALDGLEEGIETPDHDVVSTVIVVAITGSLVQQTLAKRLTALEIAVQGLDKLRHRERRTVKDLMFEGGKAVGQATDADPLDITGVVAGASVVVITPGRDAVVGEDAQKRCGRPIRKCLFE